MNTNSEEYKRAEAIVKLSGIYPEDFISFSTFDGVVKMVATITAHNELSKYTRAPTRVKDLVMRRVVRAIRSRRKNTKRKTVRPHLKRRRYED